MCGLAGIAGNISDKTIVPSMLAIMQHRGPDAQGFFFSEKVHLGHCRLSINDLSEQAKQPFISQNKDIAVIVNGEVYNYKELREQLRLQGYRFKSDSDSEVCLHGYLEHGTDFVKQLNGMFAIAIWDGQREKLILFRDRLGIKPLYYTKTDSAFLFASEIKALAQYDSVDLATDWQSFSEYLAFENYYSNRTLNKSVKLVEPGEIVTIPLYNLKIERKYFWKPVFNEKAHLYDEDIYTRYREIACSSVVRHLISDVPLGFYLSSGIDSSSVVYWASQELGQNLKTYTGCFGKQGFYDESGDAAKIAETFNCFNHKVLITPHDFIDNIEHVLWHLDEPRVGMGAFSQYMVAKQASEEVKVILTGHGGDEFFAGYPVFKAIYGKQHPMQLLMNASPRELMFAVYFTFFPFIKKETGYFFPNIYSDKLIRKILKSEFKEVVSSGVNSLKELTALQNQCDNEYQRLTLTYLRCYLPSLFIVEDKISMAFSLESRTPLCDNEMLDMALSLPLATKLSGLELKHIPRTAMRGKLPEFVYHLPKRGFPTPLSHWFKNDLRTYIQSFILDNYKYIDMFKKKEVEKIIAKHLNSKINTPLDEINAHKIWILLNLVIYFRNQKQRYRI